MDAFARRLLRWYDQHGRHNLPWQHPRTPYRVWVSEIMLQQTQVATVMPYFTRWITALPNLPALAAASEDQVMALWSGLGYYRRARHLHATAQICMTRHAGALPEDFAALAALPGIGRSTAGAILALAHGQRHAILDGNVKRVLARLHGVRGWPGERNVELALWAHAQAHTPVVRLADYTQAIMDFGATVCTRARPRCDACPQAQTCVAHLQCLTSQLPAPRPARSLPEKHTCFIVLRDPRNRILLQRRPPTGVWPGLWSLPEAADAQSALVLATELAALRDPVATTLRVIRHSFTHFTLLATPLEWRCARSHPHTADAPGQRWCSRAECAELGMPAPVRAFLCKQGAA